MSASDSPRRDRGSLWTRGYQWALLAVRAQRRRWRWFDHLMHAGGRYRRSQGDLLAAGVTYFVFLGLFPVLLLVASIVGLVLAGNALLQQQLYDAIRQAFPGALGEQLVHQLSGAIASAGVVGLVGAVGFLYAGLRTMDKLRIGMEQLWKGSVDEPEFLRDNIQDLLALLALGGLALASLFLTGSVTRATSWVLAALGLSHATGFGVLSMVLGIGLAVLGDVAAFLWLLRVVPSVSLPLRLLLPGALFGAAGVEVLKLLGTYYLSLIANSVTAAAFGGAVGLLVWINVVARFAFFTAAWTATFPVVEALTCPVPDAEPPAPDAEPPPPPLPQRRRVTPVRVAAGLLCAGAVLGAAVSRLVPPARARAAARGDGPGTSPPR